MIKEVVRVSLNAAILFCVISFLSFLFSLISNHLKYTSPNLEVGFPFNYYHQFVVKNNGSGLELLHGSNIRNCILNYLICLMAILIISNKHSIFNQKPQTINHK